MDSTDDRRKDAGEAPRSLERLRAGGGVPEGYAEKAMNSLMSLHADLMAEKERTLDLTRRLLEERQARAEVESYVRLLEAEVARLGGPDLRGLHGRGDDLVRAGEALLQGFRGEAASEEAPVARHAEVASEEAAVAEQAEPAADRAPADGVRDGASGGAPAAEPSSALPERIPAPPSARPASRPHLVPVPAPPPPSPGYRPPVLVEEGGEAPSEAPTASDAATGAEVAGEARPARAAGAEDWRQW